MIISPSSATVLAELTQDFDDPDVDFRRSLTQLADQVRSAVPSFLGVSLILTTPLTRIVVDGMEGLVAPGDIRSSLRIPAMRILFGSGPGEAPGQEEIALVLYTGRPGSLVDLAADLGWLTGLPEADFALDQDLTGPAPSADDLGLESMINQTIGVLLGRGETPDQALMRISRRASTRGISRSAAAAAILAEFLDNSPEP